MNLYGRRKHLFDLAVAQRIARREPMPSHWAGVKPANGIFNIGSGAARSFHDLILSADTAVGAISKIEYVDMPEHIRNSNSTLSSAGCQL